MTFELAPCDPVRDGELIRELTRAHFFAAMREVWDEARHQREPSDASRYTMVRRDGQTIGFFAVRRGAGHMYVQTLQLVPAARGQGIGGQLMHHIAAQARAAGLPLVRLRVLHGNDAARRLYVRLGYRTVEADERGQLLELRVAP